MFLPPLTEVLNSGFCGFYCLCQTYSQMWFSVSIFQILLNNICSLPPFSLPLPLTPHALGKEKKNHLVCHSSFVSRENRQIIFSVLNKLLYFDIRDLGVCGFSISLGDSHMDTHQWMWNSVSYHKNNLSASSQDCSLTRGKRSDSQDVAMFRNSTALVSEDWP